MIYEYGLWSKMLVGPTSIYNYNKARFSRVAYLENICYYQVASAFTDLVNVNQSLHSVCWQRQLWTWQNFMISEHQHSHLQSSFIISMFGFLIKTAPKNGNFLLSQCGLPLIIQPFPLVLTLLIPAVLPVINFSSTSDKITVRFKRLSLLFFITGQRGYEVVSWRWSM